MVMLEGVCHLLKLSAHHDLKIYLGDVLGDPGDVEGNYPDATVTWSKIRIGTIGSTYPSGLSFDCSLITSLILSSDHSTVSSLHLASSIFIALRISLFLSHKSQQLLCKCVMHRETA